MNKIKEIFNFLQQDLKKVDEIVLSFSKGKSPLIEEVSHHLISSGGKRIRPILLILASKLCNEKAQNYHNLAAAIELIHTATLLHDDVVDSSQTRRSNPTANAIWDNKVSILVGDFVFSIAFQLMVKTGNLNVLDLLAKTSSIMADGEVLQLENSQEINISLEKYHQIIYGKTAILFQAACQAPAILRGQPPQQIQNLAEFGKNLGLIFQIVDDILDYAPSTQTGKGAGDDFFEGKVTLPIILATKSANPSDKAEISELFAQNLLNSTKNPQNFAKIQKIINKYNAIQQCQDLAKTYQKQAISSLTNFPDSIYKQYLLEILDYSINRLH